jgi:hypothetical protein
MKGLMVVFGWSVVESLAISFSSLTTFGLDWGMFVSEVAESQPKSKHASAKNMALQLIWLGRENVCIDQVQKKTGR